MLSSAFSTTKVICSAGSRLLLERSIHDAVVDGLVNYVSQIKMGNPLDPDVLFGPLADAEQLKKVMQYVEYGKQDGATLRYGGERFYPDGTDGKGYYSSRPSSRMRAMKCGLLRRKSWSSADCDSI